MQSGSKPTRYLPDVVVSSTAVVRAQNDQEHKISRSLSKGYRGLQLWRRLSRTWGVDPGNPENT